MPAAETDPKAPPATGETPPDPKATPATPPTPKNEDPDGLGEAGLKALRTERARAEKAERERDSAAEERDRLKAAGQTAEEKALADAKKEGRDEATLDANRRIVRSEVRAAAGAKVTDPEDAAALLGDLDRFIVKGDVNSKAIESAIDELVKSKPYLAATGKARSLPGGRATQDSGTSFNDTIRSRIRGGH